MSFLRIGTCVAVLAFAAGSVSAQSYEQISAARDLLVAGDHGAALEVLLPAALEGHVRAANLVGAAHQHGMGVPQDLEAALAAYLIGADANYPPALFNLGTLHLNGMPGLEPDPLVAREWLLRAVEMDYAPAMGILATMMLRGMGGEADPDAARDLFARGAELGDPMSHSGYAYALLQTTNVVEVYPEVRRHYRIAALHGRPEAKLALADMLAEGQGGPTDLNQALDLYLAAALDGLPSAMHGAARVILTDPVEFRALQDLGQGLCLDILAQNPPPETMSDFCTAQTEALTKEQIAGAEAALAAFFGPAP